MADATPVQYAEDEILPATLETCRLAFWLSLTDTADADPLHRSYIREKAERLYASKAWWHIRQMLHPALWARWYRYITAIEPTPDITVALARIRKIDMGLLAEATDRPETP